jgi:phage-related protein
MVEDIGFATDPAIRTKVEAGIVQSRARFTQTKRKWSLRYEMLKSTNMSTLLAFEVARVGGSEAFYWVCPLDSVTYSVRFVGTVSYAPVYETNNTRYMVSLVLEQA